MRKALTSNSKPKWKVPREDVYKINCDGAFILWINKAGWGFVIRDHTGMAIAAGAGSANFLMRACLKGMECAAGLRMRRIILETDTGFVVKVLSAPGVDRSILGTLLDDIKALMYEEFSECIIFHISRDCNTVADALAAMGLKCMNGPLLWQSCIPEFVTLLVSGDKPD
jgi:ribonuclease HI